MVLLKEISAAFAYAPSPHLLLSTQTPYAIIAANPAFCQWSECQAETIINQSILDIPEITGITQKNLRESIESVINTRSAIKLKVGSDLPSKNLSPVNSQSGTVEVYPILENNQVICLVLQVILEPENKTDATSEGINSQISSSGAHHQSLPLIFDNLANVIFVVEVEAPDLYRFSYVNQAFEVTTGLPVNKVIGSYVQEIIPEPSFSMVLEKYREAIQYRKQVSWQEISEYPAGQKTGEVLVEPVFDTQGNCLRLVGIVHDITERKEAEKKQIRLTEDLYQHNRDLQQFTYIVSHNLRAPLANALGLVRHLPKVEQNTEIFKQYVAHLITSMEKLDNILKDVNLILSIRDRQNLEPAEPISLTEVCRDAGQDLGPDLEACGGQLHISIEPNFMVHANRAYLYSIFYNLISNAIKYRSLDRVLQININQLADNEKGIIFSDNGLGIDMLKYEKDIFNLYKRFHPGIAGRGIGLFLVRTHVEAIGGTIAVQSVPNEGTAFTIRF